MVTTPPTENLDEQHIQIPIHHTHHNHASISSSSDFQTPLRLSIETPHAPSFSGGGGANQLPKILDYDPIPETLSSSQEQTSIVISKNLTNPESRYNHSPPRSSSNVPDKKENIGMEIHDVCHPPYISTCQKFKARLNEIFFPEDPFHIFRKKDQTLVMKFVNAVQYAFPVIGWSRTYDLNVFRSDVIAGLTIASLAIPQGISYAKLANLPAIIGLYSSFVPPLIYVILGSSRHLGIGPTSVASLIIGSMLSESVSPEKETDLYVSLAFTTTFFAGLLQAGLGLFRLGFIIDFLSKATLTGFMAGVAVIVILQQLKGLFGIVHFTKQMQIIPVLESVINEEKEWSWETVVICVSFLAILLTARHISAKRPKLFWVSALAPLTSVIISTLIMFLFKKNIHGVSTIGKLPEGINPSSVKQLYFHGPYLSLVIKTGILSGILSLTEGIAVGRTCASMNNYHIDGNKEMIAIGAMNICGCLCSCYVVSGGFARSAVNYNAGAKTAFSNVIMALAVMVTMLLLMPLFYYTPNAVLASIIISAVIGFIDLSAAYHLYKLDKLDFLIFLCSFFGVLFLSVPIGLAIAVGISLLKIILNVSRPFTSVLGNIQGTQIYRDLACYSNAARVPAFLILSIESPIYFANSMYLQERILRWIREEEQRIQEAGESILKCVILDITGINIVAVTNIDSSGIEMLHQLKRTMDISLLQLVLVNPVAIVMERLRNSRFLATFESRGLYLTIGEAVIDVSSTWRC
ncbi:Probable sulfate transporter 3.4 [Linum perenne]